MARRLALPDHWRAQSLILDTTRGHLLVACSHASPDAGGAIITVDLATLQPSRTAPLACAAGEVDTSPAREGQNSYALPPASPFAFVAVRGCKGVPPSLVQVALD